MKEKNEGTVKKYIMLSEEALKRLKEGKFVEGSLHVDKENGKIIFNAWNRKSPKRATDRLICELENGWLKESAERIKFFNSVKKEVGQRIIALAMHRDLKTAMQALLKENYLNDNNLTE